MARRSLPLSKVYGLLEPGPVVLLTTARAGKANIMTLSWHTMMEFEPPLVGCVVSERNHSFRLLKATRECVINIPTVPADTRLRLRSLWSAAPLSLPWLGWVPVRSRVTPATTNAL